MTEIIKEYIDIYMITNDWDRKERHKQIQYWVKKEYSLLPTFEELTAFLSDVEKQNVIKISYPFELKVIFPVCDAEIFDKCNVQAMKLILLKYNYTLNSTKF